MNGYSLSQLQAMSLDEARDLAREIRQFLVENVSLTGGHLASNLGIVEISLALLRLFDPPKDALIYDTGHQSYVHKLLTGRLGDFSTLRQYGGISGFPKRSESEYDAFGAGHSGTAVSAALGILRARALNEKAEKAYTVAILGDGALTNGMVYEAFNNVRRTDSLIIVLNDNKMSISKSVGALAGHLNRIRTSEKYFSIKEDSHRILHHVPIVGAPLERGISRIKSDVKSMILGDNLFDQFGIFYLGPADGNDLESVEVLLREARRHSGPVLVHLVTKKGKGYAPAEQKPNKYHSVGAHFAKGGESFSQHFGSVITALARTDHTISAITAAMDEGTGLNEFKRNYPKRFFDVGICEEHGMTFAAGLSAGGLKPVFAVYSTFFQRAYDQIFHDLALQKIPALICLDRAGFADGDGPTHHGLFDVALTLQLPGVSVYSPATYAEQERILRECVREFDCVNVVRYPKGSEKARITECFACKEDLELYQTAPDMRVLFLSYGRITDEALGAAQILREKGIGAAVCKITRLKPFDPQALAEMLCAKGKFELAVFVEEGIRHGGFFEDLLSRICTNEAPGFANGYELCAVEDQYVPQGAYHELLRHCALDAQSLADKALERIKP